MGSKKEIFSDARMQRQNYIFDFAEIYKYAKSWVGWKGYDVNERKYKEYKKPNGTEYVVEWELEKSVDEYSKFLIKLKFELYGIQDVKVMVEGKETKMQKGEINVFVSAFLVLDRQNKWEDNPFLKFLKSFFEAYLYKGEIDKLGGDVWDDGWKLYNELKSFIGLYEYKVS